MACVASFPASAAVKFALQLFASCFLLLLIPSVRSLAAQATLLSKGSAARLLNPRRQLPLSVACLLDIVLSRHVSSLPRCYRLVFSCLDSRSPFLYSFF